MAARILPDAYLRVFGMSGVGYLDRLLIGFEER